MSVCKCATGISCFSYASSSILHPSLSFGWSVIVSCCFEACKLVCQGTIDAHDALLFLIAQGHDLIFNIISSLAIIINMYSKITELTSPHRLVWHISKYQCRILIRSFRWRSWRNRKSKCMLWCKLHSAWQPAGNIVHSRSAQTPPCIMHIWLFCASDPIKHCTVSITEYWPHLLILRLISFLISQSELGDVLDGTQ